MFENKHSSRKLLDKSRWCMPGWVRNQKWITSNGPGGEDSLT